MHYVVGSLSTTHVKHMRIHCECHFHTIYHIPYYIYHIPKWSHWPKHHEYFFRKTALADPILTLVVGFQLFSAAFDLLMTVVPLKDALGLENFDFWAFKKLKKLTWLHLCDYFFEMPKNHFFSILKPLLMVLLSQADKKLPKTIETPQLKSILGQLVLYS